MSKATVLINHQRKLNLSDKSFAFELGVSRGYWNSVKNGHQELTHSLEMKACKRWSQVARILLPNNITADKSSMTDSTAPSQTVSGKQEGGLLQRVVGFFIGAKKIFPQSKATVATKPQKSRRSKTQI